MTPDQFRARLKALELRQKFFAAYIGRDVMTVNRWSLGKRPIPPEIVRLLELMTATDAWRAELAAGDAEPIGAAGAGDQVAPVDPQT